MFHYIQRIFRPHPFHDIIECLAAALEAKDFYTSGHSSRVGDMSYDLGRAMGLKGSELENIHIAAHLHDIGKMGISETILNKKGKLLPHEFAQIQTHPEIGYKILAKSKGLQKMAEIVLHHHERWDGKGYPAGLREDKIPLGSRIIAVADSMGCHDVDKTISTSLVLGGMLGGDPYQQRHTIRPCGGGSSGKTVEKVEGAVARVAEG